MKTGNLGSISVTLPLVLALTCNSIVGSAALSQPAPLCPTCAHHDGTAPGLIPQQAPLQGGTGSAMLQTGTQNTMLQTGTQNTMLQTGTTGAMIQAGVERQAQQLNIEILIDCSQSMKEGLGGPLGSHEEKMNAAKIVLEQAMQMIPTDVNIGLRVFGQSFSNDPYLDCQQTALLVPIANHNRRAIVERVRQIKPFGLTPLTYALREAANDLEQMPGLKQIILISDGAETCGQDPCAMVRAITARGINMKINIVGLGLKRDYQARAQLNCIASASGGKYYDANTAAEMIQSIRDTVKEAVGQSRVSGRVLTKLKNPNVLNGPPGDKTALPADLK